MIDSAKSMTNSDLKGLKDDQPPIFVLLGLALIMGSWAKALASVPSEIRLQDWLFILIVETPLILAFLLLLIRRTRIFGLWLALILSGIGAVLWLNAFVSSVGDILWGISMDYILGLTCYLGFPITVIAAWKSLSRLRKGKSDTGPIKQQ